LAARTALRHDSATGRAARDRLGFLRHRARAGRRARRRNDRRQRAPSSQRPGPATSASRSPTACIPSNPAVDGFGNIYVTFSGSRGQKTPVSVYKIDLQHAEAVRQDLMNATGLAFDADGVLYVSSRTKASSIRSRPAGTAQYVEGMGVATGIAFDPTELYVGDRSGTIFKISRERQIYVFATSSRRLPPIIWRSVPTDTSTSPDPPRPASIPCIAFRRRAKWRFLPRPGPAARHGVRRQGNLYVAASLGGRRGVVRITPDAQSELFLSGPGIVGLAFAPSQAMILATNNALYRVDVGIAGKPLP
jgi:hypothetical protein